MCNDSYFEARGLVSILSRFFHIFKSQTFCVLSRLSTVLIPLSSDPVLLQAINECKAILIQNTSHSSSSHRSHMRPKIVARDKSCRVTGFSDKETIAAHIVARNHAEQRGVLAKHVDHAANMIMLLKELVEAYDRFEWCFDEQGIIHILYRYTPVLMYLVPPARGHLAPEGKGGPRLEYIRIAHQGALIQARERCADCWVVRVDLFKFMFAIFLRRLFLNVRDRVVFYSEPVITPAVRPSAVLSSNLSEFTEPQVRLPQDLDKHRATCPHRSTFDSRRSPTPPNRSPLAASSSASPTLVASSGLSRLSPPNRAHAACVPVSSQVLVASDRLAIAMPGIAAGFAPSAAQRGSTSASCGLAMAISAGIVQGSRPRCGSYD